MPEDPSILKDRLFSERESNFSIVRETTDLPESVVEYLRRFQGYDQVAEWGEDFDRGDVETPYPDNRMLFRSSRQQSSCRCGSLGGIAAFPLMPTSSIERVALDVVMRWG